MICRHLLYSHILVVSYIITGWYIGNILDVNWIPPNNNLQLNFIDIFLFNFKSIFVLGMLSLLGPVGLLSILVLAIDTGVGIARIESYYSVPTLMILKGLLPHGIGELFVISVINSHALKVTKYWIDYFQNKSTVAPTKFMLREIEKLRNSLALATSVLLISAYIETKYSLNYFYKLRR